MRIALVSTIGTRVAAASIGAAIVALAAMPAVAQQPRVERLAWLQGCWEMPSPQGTFEEQWRSEGQTRRIDFAYRRVLCPGAGARQATER